MEEMVAFGEGLLDEDATSASDRLRRLGRRLLRTIADNLPELTIFFREGDSLTGERRAHLHAVRDRFEEVCVGIFEQGVRAGELRASGPLVVKKFLGLHNYSYLWMQPDGDSSPEEIADLSSTSSCTARAPTGASQLTTHPELRTPCRVDENGKPHLPGPNTRQEAT